MLEQIINQYAQDEFDNNDDAAVVAKLNELSITISDNSLYTWAGVALHTGPEAAEQLRIGLESNGMGWAVHQFGGAGLELTNPLVMGAIQNFILAGINLQPLIDHVVTNTSPALQTIGRSVTLNDVSSYRLSIRKQEIMNTASNRWNTYIDALNSWNGIGEEPSL